MRKIERIVLHCSDSEFGDAAMIDAWHRERGFRCIGYHYVICNGYQTKSAFDGGVRDETDGVVQLGRDEEEIGAHVEGYNANSIGVCLIGRGVYSELQMETARGLIVGKLLVKYPQAQLVGHYELNPDKTCPMIEMNALRKNWALAPLAHLPK